MMMNMKNFKSSIDNLKINNIKINRIKNNLMKNYINNKSKMKLKFYKIIKENKIFYK
jgi:hypothetical protein